MFEVPWRSQRSARRHHDSGGAWAGRGKSTITRAPRVPATCPSLALDTSLSRLGVRAVDVLTIHAWPSCLRSGSKMSASESHRVDDGFPLRRYRSARTLARGRARPPGSDSFGRVRYARETERP